MTYVERLLALRRGACEQLGISRFSRPALNDLDTRLGKYLPSRDGVFIEAGANDGFTQSNTYYLEKFRGWRGILVEAIPVLFQKARSRRPNSKVFNCALVPPERAGEEVSLTYGNLMSVVDGAMGNPDADAAHIARAKQHDPSAGSFKVSVPGRTLSSVIAESGFEKIDFLSLDVEGFETQVLQGLDFSRHRPTWICVEARFPDEVHALLGTHYEMVEQLTRLDRLYRVKTTQA